MEPLFFETAVVTIFAAVAGAAASYLQQPPLLGYLAAGVLLGHFPFIKISEPEFFHLFSKLGVTFLLFTVGLEMNFKTIRDEGRAAFVAGLGQIIFTFASGLLLARLLGFSWLVSAYLSLALTFSSTIIVVKLLSEKNELDALYGKIALSILLVQDLVAVLVLVYLSSSPLNEAGFAFVPLLLIILKMTLFLLVVFLLSKSLVPKVFDSLASSPEVLFLFSLAWCFFLSALVSSSYIGFSIEIGGLLAGLSLANSIESFQVAAWLRPLRDYFLTMFFVVLGMQMSFFSLEKVFLPAAVFSVFVLVVSPFIVFLTLIFLGYKSRTAFLSGVSLAQISEFSLIIFALGLKLGHLDAALLTLVTIVGIFTMAVSSYFILHGTALYDRLARPLRFFERGGKGEDSLPGRKLKNHIILVGCDRMGKSILRSFGKFKGGRLLIVDFNPKVVNDLKKAGKLVVFGDITAPGIFEQANPDSARILVSTIPEEEENVFLLKKLRGLKRRPLVIVTAVKASAAENLYRLGADYVAFPQFIGGQYLADILKSGDIGCRINSLKKEQIAWFTELEKAYQPRVDA